MSPLRFLLTALAGAAATLLLAWLLRPPVPASAPPAAVAVAEAREAVGAAGEEPAGDEADADEIVHVVQPGEAMGRILQEYGLPVQAVLDAARPIHDLARIAAGRELRLRRGGDGAVTELRYPLDRDRTLVVARGGDGTWTARVDEVRYDHHVGVRAFVVEHSLWEAATAAGLEPADIVELARVLEYDVDLNTEVRPGATARIVADELWRDGEPDHLGALLAVRFDNAGRRTLAIRHEAADGTVGYYDEEGVSRRRAFLRSPLAFSRVTSGFSRSRYHPILKRRRAHLGTDFGAPAGTPVRAVGDGRVVFAGRNGGHGNYVKINHPGRYASSYSHLSRIRVRRGQRVHQGDVIGYVGSTGLSTGPHLHFQFWVGGRIVDFMRVDLPRTQRLPASEMPRFREEAARMLALLDGIADDGVDEPRLGGDDGVGGP